MTSGQRYTCAAAILLGIVVLAFGMPSTHLERSAAAFPTASRDRLSTGGPASTKPSLDLRITTSLSVPARTAPASGTGDLMDIATTPGAGGGVVAIVRPAAISDPPGRDDASMASFFLSRAGFAYTTVDLGEDLSTCQTALAKGRIFLLSEPPSPVLEQCLLGGHGVVISHDPAPQAGAFSTRRAVHDSLLDFGRWAGRTKAVSGRVGVVADRSLQTEIERALPRLRATGIAVTAVTYLDAGPGDDQAVAEGVRTFAADGIGSVIFAIDVDHQTRWVAQSSVLSPNTHYIVADAADAITDEAYPAVFDGALAYTAQRSPWFERAHGESAPEAACRTSWESAVAPPKTLGESELVHAFMWCQEVSMVGVALQATGPAIGFADALRSQTVDSPLTSSLRRLHDGTFGPSQDAVLRWSAACACWTEVTGFADRSTK